MRTKLAAFMLMVGAASGQVLMTPTNVRDTVQSGPAYTLSGVAGAYRITYTVESTAGVPLSLDDGSALRLYVWGADGHLVSSNSPSGQPLAPLSDGKVKFTFANISAGEYRIQGVATPASGDTNENWNFTHHMLTVTNPASSGGGIQVVPTNINLALTIHNTTINTGIVGVAVTTNAAPAGVTTNGDGVAVINIPPSTGSGGGDAPPINGQRPTNWTFNASYPFTVTTATNAEGGTITYGLSGSAGTVVIPAVNTSTSFIYYVDTNAQFYTASPIATQLLFFAIGSAAGNSAGGLAMRYVACTGSQVFTCYIPQGGLSVSNATAQGGWGYVRGGSATSTNGNYASSGGGSLAVLADTNVVIHLGGAGGTTYSSSRVNGGGVNGYSYGTTASGGGATATNHGAAATAAAGATAGSSTSGGNGTAAGGAYPGGGGGGGPFAGGGGCGTGYANGGPGGAGSTDVWDGYTARSAPDSASPPSTDHVLYKTPYGVGLTTITNNARANSGFLAIVSYSSP